MSVKVAKFEIKGHFFRVFKFFYYIKQIDSMLPCVCSVIDHRGRQNVVRTSVTHSAAPRVPLFCSYHILTSSVIYYWTDARQHGIYLLNIQRFTFSNEVSLFLYRLRRSLTQLNWINYSLYLYNNYFLKNTTPQKNYFCKNSNRNIIIQNQCRDKFGHWRDYEK